MTEQELRLVSTWESLTKDNEGEAHIHTLHKYDALPDEVSEATFITQARPTIIRPTARKRPQRADSLSVAFGDAQIGFRGDEPFHDEMAMKLAVRAVAELQPDNIIMTGDMLDLPGMSRFASRPDWQFKTQQSIDTFHTFLGSLRANAPNARIVAVGGNHEERMLKSVRDNAAEVLGLRRANAARELAVLTVPFLCRFEELGVENVDGYPNAAFWLTDDLKVTHGTNTQKGGSNAARYLRQEDSSTIYGHTHRIELAYRTIATRLGSRTIAAASPGCLARTDGAVPGAFHSVDSEGRTVMRSQDWQQGLLLIEHNDRNFHISPVKMDETMSLFGKQYPRAA